MHQRDCAVRVLQIVGDLLAKGVKGARLHLEDLLAAAYVGDVTRARKLDLVAGGVRRKIALDHGVKPLFAKRADAVLPFAARKKKRFGAK